MVARSPGIGVDVYVVFVGKQLMAGIVVVPTVIRMSATPWMTRTL
jgi:hypothetical protein